MDTFSRVLYISDWPELVQQADSLSSQLESRGFRPQAARVVKAFVRAREQLTDLAIRFSAQATDAMREVEKAERHRPDTGGGGGERLEDHILAEPLNVIPGSVGLNNETQMDKNVRWWRALEEGTDALVGRVLYGHFYEADFVNPSAPNAAEAGKHPLFRSERPFQGEDRASGVIRNPIPERRMILHGIEAIEKHWHSQIALIRDELAAEWGKAMESAIAEARAKQSQIPGAKRK